MRRAALAVIASLTLVAPVARGNGRFPAAGQIVVHPQDPARVVVRATYGILATNTGHEPFGLVCEKVVGYGDNQDPAMAITQDGTLLAGVVDGLSVSHDGGCTWAFAEELGDTYVLDVSTVRSDPSRAVALAYGQTPTSGGESVAQVWQTADDGKTWTRAGVDLPLDFFGLTLDVADATDRIYVSGRYDEPSQQGALLRSDDGGMTWESFDVLGTTEALPYIAAVDPADGERVYVRLDGDPNDLLLYTDDGGASFVEKHLGNGSLLAFALSPDGKTVVMGGEDEGVLRASASDLSFARVSDVAPRCFQWATDGLWACADEFRDAFTVGFSTDDGETFEPRMHLQSVCSLIDCPADSQLALECPDYLGVVKATLQSQCPEPAPPPPPPIDDCSCETPASGRSAPASLSFAFAVCALLFARRRGGVCSGGCPPRATTPSGS